MDKDIFDCFEESPYKSMKVSSYFKSYESLFSQYRGKEITFVEIGILNGGSLFMWRDYFGPKAKIIGVDLNPNAKKWEKYGFEIFIGNQTDTKFWDFFKKEVGAIDIVLDDGGHTYEQQIITTECLLDHINDRGMIVIEDTCTSYMDGYGPKQYSFLNYVKNKIDQINYRFSFDNKTPKEEKRIWSIEIIESIVAFKINKSESYKKSELIFNYGSDDEKAFDFRYEDNKSIYFLSYVANKFKFFKNNSFVKFLYNYLLNYFAGKKFKAKKYFKNIEE